MRPRAEPRSVERFVQEGAWNLLVRDAAPGDLEAVVRAAGPAAEPGARGGDGSPDVAVQFVDRAEPPPARVLDGGRYAYDDEGLWVLSPRGHPLARIAEREACVEILAVRGVREVPLLGEVLDLAAMERGWVPVHGSAWRDTHGRGIVLSGWARSGKTGALLAAWIRGGATPVGDDRLLLRARGRAPGTTGASASGAMVSGIGRPVAVKTWHMVELGPFGGARPGVAGRLEPVFRALERGGASPAGGIRALAGRVAGRVLDRRRAEIHLGRPPGRLDRSRPPLGARLAVEPEDPRPRAPVALVVVLETHRRATIDAEPLAPAVAVERIAAQTVSDLGAAIRAEPALRYAAGGAMRRLGAGAAMGRIEPLLRAALEGVPTWSVRHPYPCRLDALYEVVARLPVAAGTPASPDGRGRHR